MLIRMTSSQSVCDETDLWYPFELRPSSMGLNVGIDNAANVSLQSKKITSVVE